MGLHFSECSERCNPSHRKRCYVRVLLYLRPALFVPPSPEFFSKWMIKIRGVMKEKQIQQFFSLPSHLPHLYSFIWWNNTDQVIAAHPISKEDAVVSNCMDLNTNPSELVWTRLDTCHGDLLTLFHPLQKQFIIDHPEDFFFFWPTSMWTFDCVDRCRRSHFPMAFYTLAGWERVWGLKWDGVPSLVKPLITWLSKHNQGCHFVDHPPLTHECID